MEQMGKNGDKIRKNAPAVVICRGQVFLKNGFNSYQRKFGSTVLK